MPTFLMSKPLYYKVAYEINPWMRMKQAVDHERAVLQWQALYDVLRQKLKVRVKLVKPVRGWPDMVFAANGGLVVGRRTIISNFRYPQRQGEAKHFSRWFQKNRYRLIRLPQKFRFEGEGDALKVGDTWFFGYHFRSDIASHQKISELLKARVLSLELTDKRFYHLDTCFLPLSKESCLYYPKAFDPYARKLIRQYVKDAIAVPLSDALKFVCNGVVVGKKMVVHQGVSKKIRNALARRGFKLIQIDLSEFIKAGGSAKCLVLNI